jgi:polygalacturonase
VRWNQTLPLPLLLSARLAVAGAPALPVINTNNVFNVTNSAYGASTGSADNASAIQNAIGAAAGASGGGTVEIPGPGTYLSGPLTMKSKVNLQIDSGATLMMLPYGTWPGTTTFIDGSSLSDVEISGSGTIDGQGAVWWDEFNSNSISRPNFIQFSSTARLLIQNVTLQNPPIFHLMLKSKNTDITIQGINIDTPYPSPNTDGMDIGSTNMLIQNCHISDGDDNLEIGSSSEVAAFITVTNCVFGHGHGVSVGSDLNAGVHDLTVVDCVFTNTDNGIRLKSDDSHGGLVQDLNYYNLGMTNITYAPILIYSYYKSYGNPTTAGITPSVAAGTAVKAVTNNTPIWENVVISNLTATAGQSGMIWARTELPATNILLSRLNITASGPFDLYNVRGLEIVDSTINTASYALFNAQTIFSNSMPGAGALSLTGTEVTNALAFYNQPVSLSDSTAFDATAITLDGSALADATSLTLIASLPVNFALGTNVATVAVTGTVTLNNTNNISDGGGFGPGTYTLFSYTSGSLSGTPVLGAKPAGFSYTLTNNAVARQVDLIVTSTNAGVVLPPRFGGAALLGDGDLLLYGNGGPPNSNYVVLASANLALPSGQWKRLTTNSFDASGNFAITNTPGTNPQTFFRLLLL